MTLVIMIILFGILTWWGGVSINETYNAWLEGKDKSVVRNYAIVTVLVAIVAWGAVFLGYILPHLPA